MSKTFFYFRTFMYGIAGTLAISGPANSQAIDVVFKIDESGSMGDDIAAVKANVVTIFNALPAGSGVGLVGYGAIGDSAHNPSGGLPHVHSSITTDATAFSAAVDELVAFGGFEPGYLAVKLAAEDNVYDESLRFTGAPYCNILITDETLNQDATTQADAVNAMKAKGGIFFGILPSFLFSDAQQLATETGGQLFDLDQFRQDATPVIEAVLAACVEAAAPVKIDIKPRSCPNPFRLTDKGTVPVAILGSETFDVTRVKPETVKLEGSCAAVRSAIGDVATPYDGGFSTPPVANECTIAGPDGYLDLTLKFDARCLAVTQGTLTKRETRLWTLTGKYVNDNGDEVDFEAKDVVRVAP